MTGAGGTSTTPTTSSSSWTPGRRRGRLRRRAGATFLAPILDELRACLPLRHAVEPLGIVSRELLVPCVMGVVLDASPSDGDRVESTAARPKG